MSYFEDWSIDVDQIDQEPDEQPCPNPSNSSRERIDGLGHEPIREARCGMTTLLRGPDGQRKFGRLKCGKLACRDCGPVLRAERIDGYLDKIGDAPVVRLLVPFDRWETVRRRFGARPATKTRPARPAVNYLRFETGHQLYVVLAEATAPAPGGIVTDLREALVSAYEQLPPGGRVSSSRAWKLAAVVESEPSGWTLEAVTHRPLEEVQELAQSYGLLGRDGLTVRPGVPEAQWLAFYQRAGFHQPDHHRWWTAAA